MALTDANDASVPKRRNWKLWLFVVFIVLPVLLFSAYTWITLHYVYAKGERTGFVQKISKKGWVFKTWEGELAMVNLPGTAPEIFAFSVREDAVAGELQKSMGQRVVLHYDQHRGIPGTWFGETQHFVTGVTAVSDGMPVVPPK